MLHARCTIDKTVFTVVRRTYDTHFWCHSSTELHLIAATVECSPQKMASTTIFLIVTQKIVQCDPSLREPIWEPKL